MQMGAPLTDMQVEGRLSQVILSDSEKGWWSLETEPLCFFDFLQGEALVPSCLLVSAQETPDETQSEVKLKHRHRNLCTNSAHTRLCAPTAGPVQSVFWWQNNGILLVGPGRWCSMMGGQVLLFFPALISWTTMWVPEHKDYSRKCSEAGRSRKYCNSSVVYITQEDFKLLTFTSLCFCETQGFPFVLYCPLNNVDSRSTNLNVLPD